MAGDPGATSTRNSIDKDSVRVAIQPEVLASFFMAWYLAIFGPSEDITIRLSNIAREVNRLVSQDMIFYSRSPSSRC